jgi:hypothetical protein
MSKCDKCDYPNPECQKCVEELHAEYACFKNDTEQRLAKAERLLNAADEEKAKLCAELETEQKWNQNAKDLLLSCNIVCKYGAPGSDLRNIGDAIDRLLGG